jgi:catechol 2,3-dioxygenase-like lactoylglutathione lyase family enzyme
VLGQYDPIAFVHTIDVERARQFYVEDLGLEQLEESPFALVVRAGRTMIRITPVATHVASEHTVLGWSVPDIEDIVRALIERHVTTLRFDGLEQDVLGVWCAPGGAKVAWFKDPDDNTLSVTQF